MWENLDCLLNKKRKRERRFDVPYFKICNMIMLDIKVTTNLITFIPQKSSFYWLISLCYSIYQLLQLNLCLVLTNCQALLSFRTGCVWYWPSRDKSEMPLSYASCSSCRISLFVFFFLPVHTLSCSLFLMLSFAFELCRHGFNRGSPFYAKVNEKLLMLTLLKEYIKRNITFTDMLYNFL